MGSSDTGQVSDTLRLFERLDESRVFRAVGWGFYALVVAVAVLSLWGWFGRAFYPELTTHFKLQYAILATLCIPAFAIARSWSRLTLAVAVAALNWSLVVPFYMAPAEHAPAPAGTHLRILLSNVRARNQNYAEVAALIDRANPDVVVLQEATEGLWAELEPVRARYPHSKSSLGGVGGIAILSRMPLDWVSVLSFDATGHNAILARIDTGGVPVSLLAMHPPPPLRARLFAQRNGQLEKAAAIMRELDGPRVLVGDLNTSPWSPYFVNLVASSGLRDMRIGAGVRPTWPASFPAIMRIPIDHCLASDDVAVTSFETWTYPGSDHQALTVDLSIAPIGSPAPTSAVSFRTGRCRAPGA